MELFPAVIVHGLNDARAALAGGEAVTLLSAPGAASYAGCGWWKAVVAAARAEHPNVPCADILDCADASGHALAALRIGVTRLILWPTAPGRDAVVAIAESLGGCVLAAAPALRPPLHYPATNNDVSSTILLNRPRETRPNGDKRRPPG
jgi:hypothetical protein